MNSILPYIHQNQYQTQYKCLCLFRIQLFIHVTLKYIFGKIRLAIVEDQIHLICLNATMLYYNVIYRGSIVVFSIIVKIMALEILPITHLFFLTIILVLVFSKGSNWYQRYIVIGNGRTGMHLSFVFIE